MAKYIHTGKVNLPKTLLGVALGGVLSILAGVIYGALMDICPLIILDLLILALGIALVVAITIGMVHLGAVRNKMVKFMLALFISALTWYSAWAYLVNRDLLDDFLKVGRTFDHIERYLNTHSLSIGKFTSSSSIPIEGSGMWILAGIEALLFLLPVVLAFTFSKDYFCESCQKFNEHQKFYVTGELNADTVDSAAYTGNLSTLAKLHRREKIPSVTEQPDLTASVYLVDISYCKACKRNGVANISKGHFKLNDKKTEVEFKSVSEVMADTLIDESSVAAFIDPQKSGDAYLI